MTLMGRTKADPTPHLHTQQSIRSVFTRIFRVIRGLLKTARHTAAGAEGE